jgi:O-antigen/teichoic acid export membrane protein
MFSVVTDLGLTSVLIRESAKDHGRAARYLNQVLTLKLPLVVLGVLVSVLGVRLAGYPPEARALVDAVAAVLALDAISLTFYGLLRGHHVLKYEGLGLVMGQLVTLAIGVTAMATDAPVRWLAYALVAGSAWNALASVWIVKRKLGIAPRLLWDGALVRELVRAAWPFALAGAFVKVYTNVDAVLLTRISGAYAAGLYSVPYKLTFAFQFIPMGFTAAFYPAMSRAYAKEPERLGELLFKALRALALIVAPIVAGIMALAPEIVRLVYGADYAASARPLQGLILVLLFVFLDFPIGSLLNATDRQLTQTGLMGLATAVSVALNLWLIPTRGVDGVVIASVVSHAVLLVGGFLAVGRFLDWGASRFLGEALRIAAAAVSMGLAVLLVKPHAPVPAAILVGAVAYPALAFLCGAVRKADLAELKSGLMRRA